MRYPDTYTFHFNTQYSMDLRNAINDRSKFSLEKEHEVSNKGRRYTYMAWHRICAIMDRLDDTINYINRMELGKCRDKRSAFDFYEFINNAYIVIDCVKTIGSIFNIDAELIKSIEHSNDVFGAAINGMSSDGQYFNYVRSLCAVHPINTNNRQQYPWIKEGQVHCCPYVIWNRGYPFLGNENADLGAYVYTSERSSKSNFLSLYIKQFEKYLGKWVDLIPKVIEAKNTYTDGKYEELRQKPVKTLEDLNNSIIDYLKYLKKEYCDRFDDDQEYIFDTFIRVFSIKLSNSKNAKKLELYRNAIRYALKFYRNALQNMSFEGYENNGIPHPDIGVETDLLDLLSNIGVYSESLAKYGYELEKVYYLEPDGPYHTFDKHYARSLLNAPKELINQYVVFTNEESDEEVIVLISLAKYLDALTQKTLLNRNIPNEKAYRVKLLSQQELDNLLREEPTDDEKPEFNFEELLKKYGV